MDIAKSMSFLAASLLAACATTPATAPRPPLKSGLDLSGFDLAVRPQDDLFLYTDGTWLAKTTIPPDLSNYGTLTQLQDAAQAHLRELLEAAVRAQAPAGSDQRKAADFYTSFMDTATIQQRGLSGLSDEFARIEAMATPADVAGYIGHDQAMGIGQPLAWSVQQDAGNAQAYIIELDQSGLTMPDRDYYLRPDARYRSYREQCERYMRDLLVLAGTDRAVAGADAARIMAIEHAIAQAQWTNVQNRDPVKTYNKMSLAQLQQLAPQFDWGAFFAGIGAPAPELSVSQPSYVTALAKMIVAVPVADWRVYFRYKLLDNYAPYLPPAFDQLQFQFHSQTLSGVQQQQPRWKRAVALLDGSIGEITGRMYVEKYFSPQSKRAAQQLVSNLLATYKEAIDGLDWMSPQTKISAQRKLAAIMVKIGYPDKWRDYSTLQIAPDDLIGNVERSAQFEHQRMIRRIGQPVDRTEWDMTPPTVNAYYDPSMNEIVFPAAILQPPLFDAQVDAAVNYGGIGAVMGHEISHGFDDQGRQFDAAGNLHDWWTAQDARRFQQRTAALAAQFSAYTVLDGQHINGEFTLGENIADLAGLSISYKAYQHSLNGEPAPVLDGYTGAQRFFLGFGQIWRRKYRDDNLRMRLSVDPHSPSRFRVDGPAGNLDAFYQAFDVKPGDRMYRAPADRVHLW